MKIGNAVFVLIATVVCGITGIHQSYGEPAPASEAELNSTSDLIIEGRVLSVRNLGGAHFIADIQVDRRIKGRLPSNPFRYSWTPPDRNSIGGMNHNVFAGQKLRLYLVYEQERYLPWASNSVDWISHVPVEHQVLPHRYGEVIYDPDAPRPAGCCRPTHRHVRSAQLRCR